MKKLVFLIFSFLAFNSFANCTNFAGNYQLDSSEEVELQIDQNQCDSIKLLFKSDKGLLVDEYQLNGKRVKHTDYPEIGLTTYVTPQFKSNDIIIQVENIWADTGKGDKHLRRIHLIGKTLLDQRGSFRDDGIFVPSAQLIYLKL